MLRVQAAIAFSYCFDLKLHLRQVRMGLGVGAVELQGAGKGSAGFVVLHLLGAHLPDEPVEGGIVGRARESAFDVGARLLVIAPVRVQVGQVVMSGHVIRVEGEHFFVLGDRTGSVELLPEGAGQVVAGGNVGGIQFEHLLVGLDGFRVFGKLHVGIAQVVQGPGVVGSLLQGLEIRLDGLLLPALPGQHHPALEGGLGVGPSLHGGWFPLFALAAVCAAVCPGDAQGEQEREGSHPQGFALRGSPGRRRSLC